MRRTLQATCFNEMANTPEVRPWLGGVQSIDLTDLIANPENFAFLTDDEQGGYFYHRKSQGLYEVHTVSVPEGRGRAMLQARSDSLRFMFRETDAIEIVTLVPDGNKGADTWAAHAGFRELFRREKAFDLMGERVGVSYRSLAYGDWVLRDKHALTTGRNFHSWIHQYTPDDHGDDPVHDAWIGATLDGCLANNPAKAIGLYNRWCGHSGYQPLTVPMLNPLVVDFRSAIVQLSSDGMQILQVREGRSPPPIEDDNGREPSLLAPPQQVLV